MENKAPEQIRLWAMREGRKLSWVAGQIPVGQADLSRWLNGKCVPRRIFRIRLTELTGIDVTPDEAWQ
jgi:hypothetical protein